jgi:hypothetical protein
MEGQPLINQPQVALIRAAAAASEGAVASPAALTTPGGAIFLGLL